MKNYLCAYIAYIYDNWMDYLPIAEFTTSNHVNAFTDVTLFFADHDFHPQTGIEPLGTYKREREQQAKLLTADKIVHRQEEIKFFLQN